MNPADYGMLWMGQYSQDRMLLDDSSMLPVGMSVMDDITQQTHTMDMNPMMGIVSEYTAATAPGPIAMTPDIIYPMSINHFDQGQQTIYSFKDDDDEDDENTMQLQQYDENCIDDQENREQYIQYDSDPDRRNSIYMAQKTIATQTNKKIKPVKRPGLVLKTPIAYQPCQDTSVIPIQRDGMAVCERCGAIGVKHSFYTKERRYCSMSCARNEIFRLGLGGTSENMQQDLNNCGGDGEGDSGDIEAELSATQLQNPNYRFKITPRDNEGLDGVMYKDILPQEELPEIPKGNRLPSPCPQDEKIMTVRRKPAELYKTFDWNIKLMDAGFFAAGVLCFSHAPGYDMWSNIGVGMKVEVENTDCDNHGIQYGTTPHSFWVATVLKICGYKALLRYEGFNNDASHDFWVNLCSSEVHPVGWCGTRGKPLIPPRTIENKYSDWKEFLVKHLSGARTLPSTFYNKISDSFRSRFRIGLVLEVVDKNTISQVKVATVHKIIGKRLFFQYFDSPPEDGFWCHEDSPLIHPVGWASTIGHTLVAPKHYLERMIAGREQIMEADEMDSTLDLFKMNFTYEDYYLGGRVSGFSKGMKLEAIDPLNLSSICVATVMEVLKFGYMMIRIDSYAADANSWFCYHEKSPCIFPVGFCNVNNIDLTPPAGYEGGSFTWESYLQDTQSAAADEYLFQRDIPQHGFAVGMKIECSDLMDPRLVCVATVAKIVGRLLKVHFDGWEDEYDQWLDCESPDMYPIGWCHLVGYKLEGPPVPVKISPKVTHKKRKKKFKTDNNKLQNQNFNTRNNTVKKDKEIFDRQRLKNELKAAVAEQSKLKNEQNYDEMIGDDDDCGDGEDEENDGYSVSGKSTSSRLNETPVTSTAATKKLDIQQRISSPVQQKQSSPSPLPNTINKNSDEKYIPRLSDLPDNHCTTELLPKSWTPVDVAQFLIVNDCKTHSDTFSKNKIDGIRMLQLTKDEIVTILGMKVGPALKIFDLIQQLKLKINSTRHLKGNNLQNKNKFL